MYNNVQNITQIIVIKNSINDNSNNGNNNNRNNNFLYLLAKICDYV